MKTSLTLLFFFAMAFAIAQAPLGINYQGSAYENGAPISQQDVALKMTLRESSATGNIAYTETHETTTDANGLFGLLIGQGTPDQGDFASVGWGDDLHFLQVELDPDGLVGPAGFQLLGTTELLSVPYSFYADRAGNADNLANFPLSVVTPSIGQVLIYNGTDWEATDLPTNTISLTAGDGIEFTPGTENGNGTISSSLGTTISSIEIEDQTITNDDMAPGVIPSISLANGDGIEFTSGTENGNGTISSSLGTTISSIEIEDQTITNDDMAPGVIPIISLANGNGIEFTPGTENGNGTISSSLGSSIDGSEIINGTITSSDVQNESLTSADIQNGSITSADLQSGLIPNTNDFVNLTSTQTISGLKTFNASTTFGSGISVSNGGSFGNDISVDGNGTFGSSSTTANVNIYNGATSGAINLYNGSSRYARMRYESSDGSFSIDNPSGDVRISDDLILQFGTSWRDLECGYISVKNSNSIYFYNSSDSQVGSMFASGGDIRINTDDRLYVNGDLHVTGTTSKQGSGSWNSPSDIRLKDLQGNYGKGLDAIKKINTILYNYKEGNPKEYSSDETYVGIIAQELQELIPEAVSEDKDGYLTVNNDPVIWALVNATQELNDKVERLERENTQLSSTASYSNNMTFALIIALFLMMLSGFFFLSKRQARLSLNY